MRYDLIAQQLESDAAALEQALWNVLASANPNQRDNPAMWKAWREAEAVLAALTRARALPPVDGLEQLAREAGEACWRAQIDPDDQRGIAETCEAIIIATLIRARGM
jgi:hypothetical protein